MMRQFECRSLLVLTAATIVGCNADLDGNETLALSKVAPVAISNPDGWRLFDRSVKSQFTPGEAPLAVTLERATPLRAIKVYGPAPYQLDVRGKGGSAL